MENELKELKSVLRSLVVSSPTQVDVRSLLRDYRNMMGAPVPLTKFGYRDPVLFLRERFSDCFVFQGAQNNPILTLIVPDTLKHIDEFVQRQKLSSTVKFKGKRRSIPEKIIRPSKQHLIASTLVPKISNTQYSSQQATPKPVPEAPRPRPQMITKNDYCKSTEIDKVPLSKSMNKLNIQDKTISKESIIKNKENKQANGNLQVPSEDSSQNKNCSQSALQNFLKKRLPLYNSSLHIEKYDNDKASSKDDDSGRQTLSSTNSSTKAALLEELKIEIKDLVTEHPEGVWVTDLIGLYRERYKRELNFSRFGYTSIISLVCVLDDTVHIQRSSDGKWLLLGTDAVPAEAERPRRYLPVSVARYAQPAHENVDPDDALPGIDFDPDVFPVDCMHFMESIPAPSLADIETGAMLESILGEVYSPSHFWLLRLGENYHAAMEDMMDEMTKYYTHGEGKDRTLALGAVRVGHYCSSVYEGDWHRSLIVRIQDCDTVKVRHIDYGTVESVALSSLKPLRREWAALPAQAVRARLAGVRPPAAGRRWPHAAASHFLHLVRDKRLVANVVAVDREEDILEVFLIDTTTEEDVCVGAQMVRAGHADARGDSALRTSECYLYPRFDALESGATPNYGEIHAYLRDGIALEYVDEYSRHVPACLPPALSERSPSPDAPPSPASAHSSAPSSEPDSDADSARALSPDSIERPPSAPPSPDAPLARVLSSPGGDATPNLSPTVARSVSAHPDIASAIDAPLGVNDRIALRPTCPPFQPRNLRPPPRPSAGPRLSTAPRQAPRSMFHPPVRTPHAFSPMLPIPGYAGFPPFPGAVPLYPPLYPPPPPVLFPHPPCSPMYGPPRPCHPPQAPSTQLQCPGPEPRVHTHSSSPATLFCPAFHESRSSLAPATPQPVDSAPPLPSSRPLSPPPPYNGTADSAQGPVAGEVTLTVSECEIFRLLSSVDPNAAHWYMVDAISRAMRTTTTQATGTISSSSTMTSSPLNPAAEEFRVPLPPGMRRPPGFD